MILFIGDDLRQVIDLQGDRAKVIPELETPALRGRVTFINVPPLGRSAAVISPP